MSEGAPVARVPTRWTVHLPPRTTVSALPVELPVSLVVEVRQLTVIPAWDTQKPPRALSAGTRIMVARVELQTLTARRWPRHLVTSPRQSTPPRKPRHLSPSTQCLWPPERLSRKIQELHPLRLTSAKPLIPRCREAKALLASLEWKALPLPVPAPRKWRSPRYLPLKKELTLTHLRPLYLD